MSDSEMSPRIPDTFPTFTHLENDDEVPWIPVRSQRNADGSESHVWEKWVALTVDAKRQAQFAL